MNVQAEPLEKKKTAAKCSSSPPLTLPSFSSLPDEITENYLARMPRCYHPTLSMVSKSFRSILSSKDLYAARSRMGTTEQCLYVCVWDSDSRLLEFFQWITLWINPDPTKTKTKDKKMSGQLLAPISSSTFDVLFDPKIADSEIYIIGAYKAIFGVRVLDCRTHVWRNGPSMNVARRYCKSCVYDGKIYVFGIREDHYVFRKAEDDESFGEVFDTNTQTWECLPEPGIKIRNHPLEEVVESEGKIHLRYKYITYACYDPKQCKWECKDETFKSLQNKTATFVSLDCVVGNVSYSFRKNGGRYNFWWRDINGGSYSEVKGLVSLGNKYKRHGGSSKATTNIVSCGGKLYVVWEGYSKKNISDVKVKIWCAEVSLEKRDGDEIWGNLEWLDVLHTIPTHCHLLHCLAISV